MPYSSIKDLPASTNKLSPRLKRMFLEVFNSIYARTGDEARAFAGAWSKVNQNKAKQKGAKRG